jgi:hypothetical protein
LKLTIRTRKNAMFYKTEHSAYVGLQPKLDYYEEDIENNLDVNKHLSLA